MPGKTSLMKNQLTRNLILLLVSVIFSVALIFAFIELPRLLDNLLQKNVGFPEFDHGLSYVEAYKTELYIQALHLRLIGYISLIIVLSFIVLGYVTRKSGWAWAGALVLFLPVFGQFALSMFFLSGLGMLRVGWLPFMDVSFDLLNLGQIAFLPYRILIWFFSLFDWYARDFLAWFFMATGALIFVWGVMTWLQTRFGKVGVATGWLYRMSRHPQYLGWIIWSYGYVIFASTVNQMKKTWGVSSSLPWLLMTMIIIGICMLEEIKMKEKYGDSYEEYRAGTPFLIPLPVWLVRIIIAPMRVIIRKERPERSREVAWVILIYTLIFMGLSLFWVDVGVSKSRQEQLLIKNPQKAIDSLLVEINQTESRRKVSEHFTAFLPLGDAAVDPMIKMLSDDWEVNREFAAMILGDIPSQRAVSHLILSLDDPDQRVRNQAAWSLGDIGSAKATESLIRKLGQDTLSVNKSDIYRALGKIGDANSWEILVQALKSKTWYHVTQALASLVSIDPDNAIPHVYQSLEHDHPQVRRKAVFILLQNPDANAIPHLEKMVCDEDFEIRFFARQAIRQINQQTGNTE
jgi:protein-S-isoprenylcysteine O-methyltransferase Ste14